MQETIKLTDSRAVFPEHEFPLRVMRVKSHRPCDLHRHAFTELVLILAGAGEHITDKGRHPLTAGDVFVVVGNTAHGYERTDEMALINILFQSRTLRLPTADLGNLPGYHALFTVEPRLRQARGFSSRLHLAEDSLGEAARLVALLDEELQRRRPGYRFMACAHLMTLIGFLSRAYSRTAEPAGSPLLCLGEVLGFMERHRADPITVEQLARVGNMSRSTLMRRFSEVMHRSPIDHLLRLRLSRACDLLAVDALHITEVALQCGFNDSNYFSRAFRKHKGMSPSDYRRHLQNMGRR
jgi:AraC-like DNA-binding protein/quercetin dioxygenase-like cupin family protein